VADGGVAQHGDRDLIKLNIAAASVGEIGDLLPVDGGEVSKEEFRIRIDLWVGEIRAAVEVHCGGRRHRDLRRHLRHPLEKGKLVSSERLCARKLG